ncbi:MFS transporter [Hoyosella altamirensis]|uniref:CP family cyanate transporter-like MFS transporter n=1 Tax=Hoyosella altamirensis TaxID=616997 RepID=A0A839RG28_9ACTN|nr:MFS transporter [Hoyosella altamirensis]MBB3035672.1 CP family cyanate transporter-like MFS transporter [Hoyosella altamirensis]
MPPFVPAEAVASDASRIEVADAAIVRGVREHLWRGRLLVFAGLLLAAFTLRLAVTSLTPLLADIGSAVGFGAVMAGVFGMMPPTMFAVAGLLTPAVMVRIGLERTALLSVVLSTLGLAVRPLAGHVTPMLLLTAIALMGMGIGNVVLPPLVKRYFSDRIALMSTLYISFVQLGTVIPAVMAIPVADAVGWRFSLGMWAAVAAAAVLPWISLTRRTRVQRTAAAGAVSVAGDGQVWRSPLGWGLAVMFGMTALMTYTFLTWLPTMLMDFGISRGDAGTLFGVFILAGLVGVLVMPTLTTRMANPYPLVAGCMSVIVAGMAGLHFAPLHGTIIWIVLLGLGPSTFPMSLTLINLRSRTDVGAARLSGFAQGFGYALACIGPFGVGVLHELTGGWTVPFAALAGVVVITLIAARHVCAPRVIEDTWRRPIFTH